MILDVHHRAVHIDQDLAMRMHAALKANLASEPAHAPSVGHTFAASTEASAGLIAAVGGSAMVVGDSTAATGFVENFARDKGRALS